MNILKTLYWIYGAVCIAIGAWAIASYIDVLFNSLYQPWNLWVLALGL